MIFLGRPFLLMGDSFFYDKFTLFITSLFSRIIYLLFEIDLSILGYYLICLSSYFFWAGFLNILLNFLFFNWDLILLIFCHFSLFFVSFWTIFLLFSIFSFFTIIFVLVIFVWFFYSFLPYLLPFFDMSELSIFFLDLYIVLFDIDDIWVLCWMVFLYLFSKTKFSKLWYWSDLDIFDSILLIIVFDE